MHYKNNLLVATATAVLTTFSLGANALACTPIDPSNNINAPMQLGNVSSTDRVYRKNGCFDAPGSELLKLVDTLGVSSIAGGGGSMDTADIYRFTWRNPTRNVTLVTDGAQIKIYKDLGGGQRTLLTSSTQFSSSLTFSAAQNSAYILEFYNSTQNGTSFIYSGIIR
jgi:hypothetical protein